MDYDIERYGSLNNISACLNLNTSESREYVYRSYELLQDRLKEAHSLLREIRDYTSAGDDQCYRPLIEKMVGKHADESS